MARGLEDKGAGKEMRIKEVAYEVASVGVALVMFPFVLHEARKQINPALMMGFDRQMKFAFGMSLTFTVILMFILWRMGVFK
jgi:hypothetical protein